MNKETIKNKFKNGMFPDENDFGELIDFADKNVTPEKTNFIEQTHNLFSHEGLLVGKTIDPATGNVIDSQTLSLSDFIPVKENTDYYVNGTHAYFRYDENKNYITGYSTRNAGTINTGGTTRYIKLTVLNNHLNGFQLNEGTTIKPYIEYGYESEITKNTRLSKEFVNSQKPVSESMNPKKEAPFEMTKLLHDSRITPSGCVTYDDYDVRWKDEEKSLKVQTIQNTSKITLSFDDEPFNLMRVSEFLVLLYVEDASKMRSMVLRTGIWQSGASDFKDGWNILRHRTSVGDLSNWETPINSMYWDVYVNEPTTFYIADVIAVRQEKAKIMFVNDHGYHDFKEIAHPQLKSRGVTTTWAINPGRLGMPLTNGEQILTQTDIEELAIDPYSEFSFHTWNPNEARTQDMNADELMAETKRCMYYLKKNGLMPRHFWRACFVGNNAPAHEALQPFMDAYASPYGNGSFELYPFRNRYNINRWGIHGRSNADFDSVFDVLRKTGSMIIFYTHGYSEEGGTHVTPAEFDYLISKIDEGLSGGWIEGTSYDKLRGEFDITDYQEIL